jgi:hypothetical protein
MCRVDDAAYVWLFSTLVQHSEYEYQNPLVPQNFSGVLLYHVNMYFHLDQEYYRKLTNH